MSITKIAGLTWYLILIHSTFLSAQNAYQVQHFTRDDGLSSNGIKGLQWDDQTGFLWMATEGGLTRYNGVDFVNFTMTNTPELSSDRMLFLLKNLDGRIYCSDENGNIFFVMQNKLQYLGQVKVDTRTTTFRLTGLIASGKMLRQSSTRLPADFGFYFAKELLVPMNDSRIILFHQDSLYDYRLGVPNPRFLIATEKESSVFYLKDHLFVFHPQHGFYRADPDSLQKVPVPLEGWKEMSSPSLFWDNGMRNPILIAGSRAWLLDYEGGRLRSKLICTAVPQEDVISYAKYAEKEDILFLATHSQGIIVIRPQVLHPVKKVTFRRSKQISSYSQVALPGGAVLTNTGNILGGRPPSPALLPIRGDFNNFLLQTPDSVLWYSRNDTIYAYRYKTRQTTAIYAGAGSITDGFAQTEGDLYMADAVGIGLIRDNRIDYEYTYPKSDINSNAPFAMLELSPGLLAIANCNGLFRFNTQTYQLDTLLHLPGTCIRALWKYKGYLFVGTYGKGIYLARNNVFRQIPMDKSGYLREAHCFMPDRLGFCWISTNKGLFRVRPEDMIQAYEQQTGDIYYHYYGKADGLEITELNGGCSPCALALNDTTLSFPSMDGLVWVNPTLPASRLPDGDIYIDEFLADGQKQNITTLARPNLASSTRELQFSLGFPAWANKENLYIEFKLEPYSEEWKAVDIANPRLSFSNLPSGDYRLLLRKQGGFGQTNYTRKESSFRIAPQWYQQPWTWLLGLCLLIGIVMISVGWRTRQLRIRQGKLEKQIAEKTQELLIKNEELERTDHIKTRLISIISHDLITPLKFLHMTGNNLITRKNTLSEEIQQEVITEITNTSKELELLSTNIMNWIKYRNEDRRLARETFNLHELVNQLFGIFGAMARQKQIRLINAVDETLTIYQFIEPVKIVMYNLILNGINFTPGGYIRVSSAIILDGIDLIIEDTGVGMTPEQITNIMADHFIISSENVDRRKGNGLGYLIIKDLLKIIRGSLFIHSIKEKGTVVTVRLPVL